MQDEPAIEPSRLRCSTCGYNLTGATVGGRCSECGTMVEASILASAREAQPRERPTHPLAGVSFVVALLSIALPPAGIPALVLAIFIQRQLGRAHYKLSSKLWADLALFLSIISTGISVVMLITRQWSW